MLVRLTEVGITEGLYEHDIWVNANHVTLVTPVEKGDDAYKMGARTSVFMMGLAGSSVDVKETPEEVCLLLRVEAERWALFCRGKEE